MDPGATSVKGVAAPAAARLRDGLRLVLVGLGISVVPLDTAVNIAFPDITGSFGLPIAMIQWVIICYVLTHAGLMLAFGRVGDMWSHGRVFRAGLLWSIAAFLLCAAAPSFGWLLFFRFLQGIGAGLIISCAPALVTSLYPEARRSHALSRRAESVSRSMTCWTSAVTRRCRTTRARRSPGNQVTPASIANDLHRRRWFAARDPAGASGSRLLTAAGLGTMACGFAVVAGRCAH